MTWLHVLRSRHTAISDDVMPRDDLPTKMPTDRANASAFADSIIAVPGGETLSMSQRIMVLKKAEYEASTNPKNTRPPS